MPKFQDMPNICQRYALDMLKLNSGYVQDLPQICKRYAEDMPNTCLKKMPCI